MHTLSMIFWVVRSGGISTYLTGNFVLYSSGDNGAYRVKSAAQDTTFVYRLLFNAEDVHQLSEVGWRQDGNSIRCLAR